MDLKTNYSTVFNFLIRKISFGIGDKFANCGRQIVCLDVINVHFGRKPYVICVP